MYVIWVGLASRIYIWLVAAGYEFANRTQRPLLGAMCQWDCHWYRTIMLDGYHPAPIVHPLHTTSDPANWAFFPLFPKLAAWLGNLLAQTPEPLRSPLMGAPVAAANPPIWRGPLDTETPESLLGLPPPDLVGAYLLNHLAFFAALAVLYRYSQVFYQQVGLGSLNGVAREPLNAQASSPDATRFARWVVLFAAFSPFSFYFSVPMTEALYFLTTVSALYLARTQRWIAAGIVAAACSATRNLGVTLVVCFAALALEFWIRQRGPRGDAAGIKKVYDTHAVLRIFCALTLVPLGLFLFMRHLQQVTGDPLAFMHIQHAWGGERLGNPFVKIWNSIWAPGLWGKICAVSGLIGLVAAFGFARLQARTQKVYDTQLDTGSDTSLEKKVLRTLASPEAWLLILGTLIPYSLKQNSMQRYVLTLFPIFIAAGVWTLKRPKLKLAFMIVSVLLLAHFTGAWLGARNFAA